MSPAKQFELKTLETLRKDLDATVQKTSQMRANIRKETMPGSPVKIQVAEQPVQSPSKEDYKINMPHQTNKVNEAGIYFPKKASYSSPAASLSVPLSSPNASLSVPLSSTPSLVQSASLSAPISGLTSMASSYRPPEDMRDFTASTPLLSSTAPLLSATPSQVFNHSDNSANAQPHLVCSLYALRGCGCKGCLDHCPDRQRLRIIIG
jgi:hypothetical protein